MVPLSGPGIAPAEALFREVPEATPFSQVTGTLAEGAGCDFLEIVDQLPAA